MSSFSPWKHLTCLPPPVNISFIFLLSLLLQCRGGHCPFRSEFITAENVTSGRFISVNSEHFVSLGAATLSRKHEEADAIESLSWQVMDVRPSLHQSVISISILLSLCLSISSYLSVLYISLRRTKEDCVEVQSVLLGYFLVLSWNKLLFSTF